MSKFKKIIIPVAIVIVVAGLLIFYTISTRTPKNPSEALGNTAGNLLNGGTFCEYDGTVYFANPYDQNRLYAMNPDCTGIERLSDDSVSYINAYGQYLYYVRNNSTGMSRDEVLFVGELYGIVRLKQNGNDETTLYAGYCSDLNLAGNTLVYNANENSVSSTFTMDLDGDDKTLIYAADFNNGSIAYDSSRNSHFIYYSNHDTDHSVYALNLETGVRSLYWTSNSYLATEYDGCLYYIDLDNNYALNCLDLSSLTLTTLTTDRVVLYNIYDGVILYQTENSADHHALKRMNTDGTGVEEITTGDFVSISCTSEYTFLTMYGSDMLYRVGTRTGTDVERFVITYE